MSQAGLLRLPVLSALLSVDRPEGRPGWLLRHARHLPGTLPAMRLVWRTPADGRSRSATRSRTCAAHRRGADPAALRGPAQAGRVMIRMGVVVGCRVPPAGSTVTPIRSARVSPEASSGVVRPVAGWGSSPASWIRPGAMNHTS
jgi:hypothetical protein